MSGMSGGARGLRLIYYRRSLQVSTLVLQTHSFVYFAMIKSHTVGWVVQDPRNRCAALFVGRKVLGLSFLLMALIHRECFCRILKARFLK